ncbi:MAG: hypothetical protein IIA65_06935 [Planctomycetes bacterium]|nr:hypothetical protein [Planctomycetota bacterium]
MNDLLQELERELEKIRSQNLYRSLTPPKGLDFCSNDYLGLSRDPNFRTAILEKLEQTEDVDGRSILDNAMIVYGSGNADGNRHTHHTLPVILAGSGGGTLQSGRYLQIENVPMSNMYLSMLDRLGIQGVDKFGDSTGRLDTI